MLLDDAERWGASDIHVHRERILPKWNSDLGEGLGNWKSRVLLDDLCTVIARNLQLHSDGHCDCCWERQGQGGLPWRFEQPGKFGDVLPDDNLRLV